MAFDLGSVLPTIIGGVLGGVGSSGTQTQTVNKDPWGPAQPYLLNNLQNLSDLQKFYQQNPLSQAQQDAYGQVLRNNHFFQDNIGPGLLGFAGSLMSQQYQRPTGGRPGEAAGYGGARQAPQAFNPSAAFVQAAGTYTPPRTVDFAAMNPYAQFIPQLQQQRAAATPAPTTGGGLLNNSMPHGENNGNGNVGGGQMDHQNIADIGNLGQTLSGVPGITSGLLGAALTALSDKMASLNDGISPESSETGYSDAKDAAAKGLGVGNTGGNSEGMGPGGGPEGGGLGGGEWNKGGPVKKGLLVGPDPKGPDEGYGKLQGGEYVIRKKAVEAIGKKKLDELNRKGK